MKNNKLQRLLTLARLYKFKPYKKPGVVLWKKVYHPGLGFIAGSFDTFDKGLKTIELISRALTEINNRKQPTKTTEGENNEAQ